VNDFLPAFGATVKALRARMDGLLRPHGLRLGQYQLLRALWERDGLTPRELADHVGVEMPTVTRTVQRMMRDGFVRREANPSDARSVRIRLTPKGQGMEEVAKGLLAQTTRVALEGVSAEDRERMNQTLQHMLANLTG
jgi:MarR family transcriptional regulator, organic hydroperoxide resistance regulator